MGKNFFNTMLRLFGEKETLNVVDDQVGAPTYAPHLAGAIAEVLKRVLVVKKFPSGIYHLCGGGETSWHGFAQAIFALARSHDSSDIRCQRINPIPTSDYPTRRQRGRSIHGSIAPRCMLCLARLCRTGKRAYKECIEVKYGRTKRQDFGA